MGTGTGTGGSGFDSASPDSLGLLACALVIALASLTLGWIWGSLAKADLARQEGVAQGWSEGLERGRELGWHAAAIQRCGESEAGRSGEAPR